MTDPSIIHRVHVELRRQRLFNGDDELEVLLLVVRVLAPAQANELRVIDALRHAVLDPDPPRERFAVHRFFPHERSLHRDIHP